MRKPEKNITKRKAAIKRGKKRSDRLKATQKTKHIRSAKRKNFIASEEKKFQEHLEKLQGH